MRLHGVSAAAVALLALLAASTAAAQAPAAVPPSGGPPPRLPGYLGPQRVPDYTVFLPPPPAPESPLAVADVAVFHATRALEGSARWQLAARDNAIGTKAMLGDFACALGVNASEAVPPALARLLSRSLADAIGIVNAAKDHYGRLRPFRVEALPTCFVPSESLALSGSYPSAHAASGWLHALLFAELDPERAAPILNRGRAFGESRVVCGVHYVSDIDAGRTVAATVVAALHGNAEFTADVAAARAELATLRGAGGAAPDAAACALEGAALATPW